MPGLNEIPRPPHRKLKAFAFDPSLQTELDKATINCVDVEIPWEDYPRKEDALPPDKGNFFKLKEGESWESDAKDGPAPGPIGDYLEVVDYDPASGYFYEPVDLNDPHLLEQHGLAPSDGNPRFHQQMVYAVAMKTITIFERALGRQVLWAPNVPGHYFGKRQEYVHRLRIYPHAFRQANAYYSPEKKALLFGYFQATEEHSGSHLPGGLVFSCLSQDIIVHEMSHAILDGMHRRFIEDSNVDVLAFHEAFADLVALFQHFTYPEIVKHQIENTRGDLKKYDNLLGKLAVEFGKAIGRSDALRNAIGKKPDPSALDRVTECHERGAILVAAVFDAFLAIYKTRTRDLIRLSTGGTGLLVEGAALHPDLVGRLAKEASKAASHILTICIRALDYLPPVDITFGDYLRAMITADRDLVPEDSLCYRPAIIEAFRERGIYPRDVRTLSEGSLVWEGPAKEGEDSRFTFVRELMNEFAGWDLTVKRNKMFSQIKAARAQTHVVFENTWVDYKGKFLEGKGLNISLDNVHEKGLFEVHSIRPVRRIGPNGQMLADLLVEITQKRPGYLDQDYGGLTKAERNQAKPEHFWFRGGCTLLIDMKTTEVRYCIYKNIDNVSRYRRQQEYLKAKWGIDTNRPFAPKDLPKSYEVEQFALLHRFRKEEKDQWA